MWKPTEFDDHPLSYRAARDAGLTRGVVKHVHDGDTVSIFIDAGHFLYGIVTLRLTTAVPGQEYFNTAEIVGKDRAKGLAAQKFLEDLVLNQPVAHRAELTKSGYGEVTTFERFIGPLWLVNSDLSYTDVALQSRGQGFDIGKV